MDWTNIKHLFASRGRMRGIIPYFVGIIIIILCCNMGNPRSPSCIFMQFEAVLKGGGITKFLPSSHHVAAEVSKLKLLRFINQWQYVTQTRVLTVSFVMGMYKINSIFPILQTQHLFFFCPKPSAGRQQELGTSVPVPVTTIHCNKFHTL